MSEMNQSRSTLRPVRRRQASLAALTLAWVWLTSAPLSAQPAEREAADAAPLAGAATGTASLPAAPEEIDRELQRLEIRLAEVRERSAAAAPEALPAELAECQELYQQWQVALGLQATSLRHLQETRQVNQGRAADAQAWRGFTHTPPYPLALVEGLRDAIAAQDLDLHTEQMLLAISEGDVERNVALLAERRRQARLARDQAEQAVFPDPRREWLRRLAETRVQTSEALLEASEVGRLVTLERLAGLRQYLEFLQRQLAIAEVHVRFTRADLDAVLARLNQRREDVRRELATAVASRAELSRALAAARADLVRAQADPGATMANRQRDVRARVDAGQTCGETSGLKVDLLRTFLALADHTQALWEDRFWATGERSLMELRNKRQARQDGLDRLRPWKRLAELRLANASSEAMGQSIRASAPELTAVEQESARRMQASFEERAGLYQRALSALMLVESTHERLMHDLAAREATLSFAGRSRFLLDRLGAFLRRLWDTELYVAEEAVIADGRKITVPRTITLGKVVIALGILLAGVLIARWGRGAVTRTAALWFKAGERAAGAMGKFVAGVIVVVAFCAAMTSVRIPWTVFAFLGGALAIGLGFGAQTLINNFISGVILLFERSIRVGDIVEVGDQRGKVVQMGFRNSLIRRSDGIDVLVPNSRFLETEVVNWTLTDDLVRYKIPVGVAYGSPVDKTAALIAQAALTHPDVAKEPAPMVLLDDFGDNALVFSLVFWMRLRPPVDGGTIRSELRRRICAWFDEAGIVLAFPQRDVHLDSARPLDVRLVQGSPSSGPDASSTPRPE